MCGVILRTPFDFRTGLDRHAYATAQRHSRHGDGQFTVWATSRSLGMSHIEVME